MINYGYIEGTNLNSSLPQTRVSFELVHGEVSS